MPLLTAPNVRNIHILARKHTIFSKKNVLDQNVNAI